MLQRRYFVNYFPSVVTQSEMVLMVDFDSLPARSGNCHFPSPTKIVVCCSRKKLCTTGNLLRRGATAVAQTVHAARLVAPIHARRRSYLRREKKFREDKVSEVRWKSQAERSGNNDARCCMGLLPSREVSILTLRQTSMSFFVSMGCWAPRPDYDEGAPG